MKRTINILVLSLILTMALAPAATAAAVICECPSKRCFSAGQWWPYCPECVCAGTTTGPEPYSQPVDSTFLKNNFSLNNDTLMQFIRDAFQSPLTQQQISDLLGQAGQPPSDGLPTYEIRSIYDSPYQYSMQEVKYDTIKLTANAKNGSPGDPCKGGGTPTLAGVPVDFRNLAAAMCAVQHGGLSDTDLQDKKLVGDIFDRFQEKMENLEQMFPNAMKNLDEATTAKLYRDAVNEVKRGQ